MPERSANPITSGRSEKQDQSTTADGLTTGNPTVNPNDPQDPASMRERSLSTASLESLNTMSEPEHRQSQILAASRGLFRENEREIIRATMELIRANSAKPGERSQTFTLKASNGNTENGGNNSETKESNEIPDDSTPANAGEDGTNNNEVN